MRQRFGLDSTQPQDIEGDLRRLSDSPGGKSSSLRGLGQPVADAARLGRSPDDRLQGDSSNDAVDLVEDDQRQANLGGLLLQQLLDESKLPVAREVLIGPVGLPGARKSRLARTTSARLDASSRTSGRVTVMKHTRADAPTI
jgi:hypothetical protein